MEIDKTYDELIKIFLDINSKINLSAIRNYEWVYQKHILDSLELNKIFKFNKNDKILDIWTWWGFPLLPLAISNPNNQFWWLDARQKKIKAVEQIVNKLWLNNVNLIRSRIENLDKRKYNFNIYTARAVAYITKFFNLIHKLLKKWDKIILYKQESQEEFEDLQKICKKHQIKLLKKHNYSLFENDITRVIYILEKI